MDTFWQDAVHDLPFFCLPPPPPSCRRKCLYFNPRSTHPQPPPPPPHHPHTHTCCYIALQRILKQRRALLATLHTHTRRQHFHHYYLLDHHHHRRSIVWRPLLEDYYCSRSTRTRRGGASFIQQHLFLLLLLPQNTLSAREKSSGERERDKRPRQPRQPAIKPKAYPFTRNEHNFISIMPPFVTLLRTTRDETAVPGAGSARATAEVRNTAGRRQSQFVHGFNDIGGRPDERRGTRGSFTPGVRIMSGGEPRDVPVEAETTHHGIVLFVSSILKPDLSGAARTNVTAGRTNERLGGYPGRFTPGIKTFFGGAPRDVPVGASIAGVGKVLFVSSVLKPDHSGEARTNPVRPMERLGSGGRFTPGVRTMRGGVRRRAPSLTRTSSEVGSDAIKRGKVLFVSSSRKPDLSFLPTFNVIGGRPDERYGTQGSFAHGVRIISGRQATSSGVELASGGVVTNPGIVLFESSIYEPDLSGEAQTNVVGGRPTERLGGDPGRFTPGIRRWLGGEPRDVPAERETGDHGIVLFPPRQSHLRHILSSPSLVAGGHVGRNPATTSSRGDDRGTNGEGWCVVESAEKREMRLEEKSFQAQKALES